jgi:hypothetical protein
MIINFQKGMNGMEDAQNDYLTVIVSDEGLVRDSIAKRIKVEELAINTKIFLEKISKMMENAPIYIGEFKFSEFEINAEVNAKGSLMLLGTGGEAGTKCGIKFVFRRSP